MSSWERLEDVKRDAGDAGRLEDAELDAEEAERLEDAEFLLPCVSSFVASVVVVPPRRLRGCSVEAGSAEPRRKLRGGWLRRGSAENPVAKLHARWLR